MADTEMSKPPSALLPHEAEAPERYLLKKDQDRAKLREALFVGATSELMEESNEEFFENLRKYVRKRAIELGR
ncbi:MAG: hypothetical protein FWC38_02960 [Proteobacteria bacterium]|nr:hypothetical protein [Pseudomonadota bacterium]MCL2307195.1 hypothetical protein [Pseudomonadota bacterium]